MANVQEQIDLGGGAWVLFVTITGFGDDAGHFRLCTHRPDFAAADDNWWPVIRQIPTFLPEKVPARGGLQESGNLTLDFVDTDVNGLTPDGSLTDALRLDSVAITETLSVLIADASNNQFTARDTSAVSVDDVLHVHEEAMKVTSKTSTQIFVDRGFLGTRPAAHGLRSPVKQYPEKLDGHLMTVSLIPKTAADETEKIEIDTYSIRKLDWVENWTTWRVVAASVVMSHKRRIGDILQAMRRITSVSRGRVFQMERIGTSRELTETSVWPGEHRYFLLDTELIIGEARGITKNGELTIIDEVSIIERGVLGTSKIDLMEDGEYDRIGPEVRIPLVADTVDGIGSWRRHESGSTDRSDAGWNGTGHFCDIIMGFYTSSKVAADGLELTNFEAGGPNWSSLPVGYGAGIPIERIAWREFEAIRARTPDWRFPGFVFSESAKLGDVLRTNFLEPLGIHIVSVSGLITPVMARLPIEGEPAPDLDHTNLLADPKPYGAALVSGGIDPTQRKGAVLFRIKGPNGEDINHLYTMGDFGGAFGQVDPSDFDDAPLLITIPGLRSDQQGIGSFLEELAARELFRWANAPRVIAAHADLSTHTMINGSLVALTFLGAPDLKLGIRGWTSIIMTVFERAIVLADLEKPGFKFGLVGYGPGAEVGRIGPSMLISAFDSGTGIVTGSQVYVDSGGAVMGLPDSDNEQWRLASAVKLIDQDGGNVVAATQIILDNTIDGEVEIDGDFGGGGPLPGKILVLADYADAIDADRDEYVADADADAALIDGTAPPWNYGEQ